MKPRDDSYTVTVGQSEVTLRKRGQSTLRSAHILGEDQQAGKRIIYLDRLLLPPGNVDLGDGWSASGCVSSILTRNVSP